SERVRGVLAVRVVRASPPKLRDTLLTVMRVNMVLQAIPRKYPAKGEPFFAHPNFIKDSSGTGIGRAFISTRGLVVPGVWTSILPVSTSKPVSGSLRTVNPLPPSK